MIENVIAWSLRNRGLVLLLTVFLIGAGLYAVSKTPLDAIPDLSDVQVIIKTSYPGQAPQVVEDQVTYPLTTTMMAVPGARTVRGYSFFGDSYVYILFEDGTDIYWARSRVLEYLNQVSGRLPAGARVAIGPDATGVGWIYQYALVDRTGTHDLAQLRSLQDWFLKYELQSIPGVAEVAAIGGMVKQYQVVVDPQRLRAYGLPLATVQEAIRRANQEAGGSVIEMGEAEYMVRATGYLSSEEDLRRVPLGVNERGTPILLGDIADVRLGPEMRRGIAELNGEGEVAGGVIILRWGKDVLSTVEAVKAKLASLKESLPKGVEIVETYDRSKLIHRAIATLERVLIEEFAVVAAVCLVFLLHIRSSGVALVTLPVGILAAFIVLKLQGINANIMSLGGIAIAIGAMVDAAIVMIENVHTHMERHKPVERHKPAPSEHWAVVERAVREVGRPLFFSLLIITVSFIPVFALEAQEGRLFKPLAFTKTYAMGAAALLSITLVPVLMGYFIRGRILPEHRNPVAVMLTALYRPLIRAVLSWPKLVIVVCVGLALTALWPLQRLGSEFMPPLHEGDLLYMPTTYPSISIGAARAILQQTDKLIRTVPEVETVFGKIGRAETATDPAPMTMVETTVQLKPQEEWRPGMTMDRLKEELNGLIRFPGLSNVWVMPIRNRIDMLATGIKTPIGVKVRGPDLAVIERVGKEIERALKPLPGTVSVYAERVTFGRYVTVDIDRMKAARYGLNIADVQEIVETAVGGMNVTETVEGLERYPVNLRYPRAARDSVEKLRLLPIVTPQGANIPLGEVADVRVTEGPSMIRSESAKPAGWIYVDISGRDLGSYVEEAKRRVAEAVTVPKGYTVSWSGQYEYLERAMQRLYVVVPATLLVIALLLYLNFRNMGEALLIMGTLPLALVGGVWLVYWLGYNLSVAVGIGFIALAGVAAETGIVMLAYLKHALEEQKDRAGREGRDLAESDLGAAVIGGALRRLRPLMMTVAAVIGGLLPIMFSTGTGSEVMRGIASPMVGGMASATVLTLAVLPAVFLLRERRALRRELRRGALR
ncbi:MAG TPA: efflux RND transporter permease subunit [Alphaproteobacteria bacterium]|nr:efflux RND transporter permease subunit [Alphaproteobacteria bacterium]